MEANLKASQRDIIGSAESRRLRNNGELPAVIYGMGMDPVSVVLDAREFNNALRSEAGARKIAGKNKKVAACAPCDEPDLTPAATEYPAKPSPQRKAIDRTIKNPILPTAGSAPIIIPINNIRPDCNKTLKAPTFIGAKIIAHLEIGIL